MPSGYWQPPHPSPNKQYVKIPEATHLMLLEEHRDDLYRATNEFLNGR